MTTGLKYGASAIALLAAVSLAQAQTSERPGAGASGSEHSMGGRRAESGPGHGERGAGADHGTGDSLREHQERTTEPGERGRSANQREPGEAGRHHGASQEGQEAQEHEEHSQGSAHHERSVERNGTDEHGRRGEQTAREGESAQRHEMGETGQPERQGQIRDQHENRAVEREESRGRENELNGGRAAGAPARPGNDHGRFASISREQRTRIHSVLMNDAAIHRYRAAEIHVPVRVGARIPDAITFDDAPPPVLRIFPSLADYKIVLLDDVILVIDPYTREIVDVIRT